LTFIRLAHRSIQSPFPDPHPFQAPHPPDLVFLFSSAGLFLPLDSVFGVLSSVVTASVASIVGVLCLVPFLPTSCFYRFFRGYVCTRGMWPCLDAAGDLRVPRTVPGSPNFSLTIEAGAGPEDPVLLWYFSFCYLNMFLLFLFFLRECFFSCDTSLPGSSSTPIVSLWVLLSKMCHCLLLYCEQSFF